MSRFNRNNVISGRYKIIDAFFVFMLLLIAVLPMGICCLIAISSLIKKDYASVILLLGLMLLGIPIFKIFLIQAKGYVVDVEADTLEYPGGGMEAESLRSYISKEYWLRAFKRLTLRISEIREVEVYSKTTRRTNSQGKVSSSTAHYLDINGEFGAIQFSFLTKGKRDELHSLLVQMNRMGNPILNR